MLCFLYTITVSACLAIAAWAVERTLPPTATRRWIWCVVLATSMILPPLFRARHTTPVPMSHTHAMAPAAAELSMWARVGAYDATLMRLWVLASATLLLVGLANLVRVAIIVRRSKNTSGGLPARMISDGIPVIVTESLGPATAGLWRSRVLVPKWVLALPVQERRYVLQHEEEHRKAHDAHLLMAASIFLVLTPWNVALWWQLKRLSLAIEIDCDNRVVSALGHAETYAAMLFKVAQASNRGPTLQPALLGGVGMLERRLTMLLAPRKLSRALQYLLPALAMIILFVVLTTPHPVVVAR